MVVLSGWATCLATDQGDPNPRLGSCGQHRPRLVLTWPHQASPRVAQSNASFKKVFEDLGIPVEEAPYEILQSLRRWTGGQEASTGLLTLAWLLSKPLANLDICGMTFFTTGYSKAHKNVDGWTEQQLLLGIRHCANHSPEREKDWVREKANSDPRIHPDAELQFLLDQGLNEAAKYEHIYSHQKDFGGYGHSNRGAEFIPILKKHQASSVLDVGCGHNEFVKSLPAGIRGVGIDVACPSADVVCDANNLPFKDKEFDYVTGFDFLEHVAPHEVPKVLGELKRVSEHYILLVSFKHETAFKVSGLSLHPSAASSDWWTAELEGRSQGNVHVTPGLDFATFHGTWAT